MQVSPTEIEETLLKHPENLIIDVSVAGVSGGRTADERVPRAWVVLSPTGEALGESEVIARLGAWVRETLSRYKWLRGGIAVVKLVRAVLCRLCPAAFLSSVSTTCRYPNHRRARCCVGCWWTRTKPSRRRGPHGCDVWLDRRVLVARGQGRHEAFSVLFFSFKKAHDRQ